MEEYSVTLSIASMMVLAYFIFYAITHTSQK